MKILYITPDITNSGGIARVISLKTNYLIDKLNYEICILTVNNNSSDSFYEFNPKIKWFKITQSKNKLLFVWRYRSLIKKSVSQTNPDVVVFCDSTLSVFIPWMVKIKKPIVFETHISAYLKKIINKGFLNAIRFVIVRFFKKITFKKMDKFIVLTQEAANEWDINNCKIIPNPRSFSLLRKSNLENKKVIAICRHSYEKGLDRLLLIWEKIVEKHPDWSLDIYGEWNTDRTYQKMAVNLEISNSVNFIAPVVNIQESYQNASIFLMTSRSESFPMALIEAISSGLPCVVYDCPNGPNAIIKNNENGFLIEDGNENLFLEKLGLLIDNKNLRVEIGDKAFKSAEQYDIEIIMKIWDDVFKDLKNKNKQNETKIE